MEIFKTENLSFTYPKRDAKALDDITIKINKGEIVCLCGKSGCGKTTLLRLLKTSLSPKGEVLGNIKFLGQDLNQTDAKTQASKMGFVMQDVENQIVTDKVWHELAFGLENLGYNQNEIRKRVSEMALFFGIDSWFHKNVWELSGGQKQLLNLASVMVMQPDVLILDEPTAQLDPIAVSEFLRILEKINRELGTTIILSEHHLEEAFAISERVLVMDNGKIIADDTPNNIGKILKEKGHPMFKALPTPMRVYGKLYDGENYPITIKDGRLWLEDFVQETQHIGEVKTGKKDICDTPCVEVKNVYFRYEKNSPDILKGISLKINKGEIFSILGGNGAGKSTLLSVISALNKQYSGEVYINGEKVQRIENLYTEVIGVLFQSSKSLFSKKTVLYELEDVTNDKKQIEYYAGLCGIDHLYESHPYDLSVGEQQRLALCKVLIKNPEILLLDEPTKGFDAEFKETFAEILFTLKENGKTVIMVSHDVEFCAYVSDRCSMLFDGIATVTAPPREFFCGNTFYTTSANRMARDVIENVLLADDIVLALGGAKEKETKKIELPKKPSQEKEKKEVKKVPVLKLSLGILLTALFIVLFSLNNNASIPLQIATLLVLGLGIGCFMPKREIAVKSKKEKIKLGKSDLCSMLFLVAVVPFTVFMGNMYLGDKRHYFISLLIILETMVSFLMAFEGKKPSARKLVVISVLCALAVGGRVAFSAIPLFKPILAIIIISGVCFGAETGFLVGAVSAFVSNFFFGQGPWTPWQMFVMGIVGFIAGLIFYKKVLKRTKIIISVFGFLVTVAVYGVIMNGASVLMMHQEFTLEAFLASCALGFPLDAVHGASTSFFLWFIAEPIIEKIERIKEKYGI